MRLPVLLTALALLAPSTAHAATADVAIGDFFFKPGYVRVEPGDTVTWTSDGSPHDVKSRPASPLAFDSGELLPGETFSQAFPAAGRYPYLCSIHDFMLGVVQVGPDTIAPKLTKLATTVRGKRVWVAFRVTETVRVSASVASAKKPKRKLRRVKARKAEEGGRSLFAKIGGLKPGRYRITLVAEDPEGNSGKASARFKIPKPRK
jgi:plastocyanin